MIYGNTSGVKKVTLSILEDLIDDYGKHLFIDREVLVTISETSSKINREICVYISRGGRLLAVGIGDSATVPLKEFNFRRGTKKFSEVRVVHTHPNGQGRLSELDISALRNLRMDCICSGGVLCGQPLDMEVAYIKEGVEPAKKYIKKALEMNDDELLQNILYYEKEIISAPEAVKEKETAILVNVTDKQGMVELDALEKLSETAGLETIDKVLQNKVAIDKNFCVGRGKVEEIKQIIQNTKADYVIFNNTLSGSQLNNLETELGVKVIDRPMLILEIFAKHATSNEGKLQVQLAIMKYTFPKLFGHGSELSRIGGGSGSNATKGAGETKLELDRRLLRRNMFELNERIEKLKKERDLRRDKRVKSGIKTVAIVGYTNAGKSTLMNKLSNAGVLAEDKLFATLDPVTRKMKYQNNKEYLITDTVGFIDNLPHEFIDAFRSTLEETKYADLLVHVVDASSEDIDRQKRVVIEVLDSLGVGDKPMLIAYNKADAVPYFQLSGEEEGFIISARTGGGVEKLKAAIEFKLFEETEEQRQEKKHNAVEHKVKITTLAELLAGDAEGNFGGNENDYED
jgi:GTP-binding protein HflX